MADTRAPHHPLAWLGRHELAALVLLLAVAGGVWGFVELADEVMEGETGSVDERILLAMRSPTDQADPVGPAWVEEIGRDLSALGGTAFLTILTLAVAGYLLLDGKRRAALFAAAAIVGGVLLSLLLKECFDRPRPDLVPHGAHVYTTSFPSGHSMMSAVTYLTLGALLARVQSRPAIKAYVLALAVLLTIAVGTSRVYVGVHWPTDVLAGWTAGATWALLCWLAAWWMQRRGRLEQESAVYGISRLGAADDALSSGGAPASGRTRCSRRPRGADATSNREML
jgi:undecaprenyl-diphosphatase